MNKTTILKPLQLKEDLPFSKKYLQQQATKVFESLKLMKTLHSLKFLIYYILMKKHLCMKEGSLFCNYEIHQTKMLHIVFLVSLESSQ
jgi:hypothetical protein